MVRSWDPSPKSDLPDTQTHNDRDKVCNVEGPTQNDCISIWFTEENGGTNIAINMSV